MLLQRNVHILSDNVMFPHVVKHLVVRVMKAAILPPPFFIF